MNKFLLLSILFLFSICVFPQAGKTTKPNGFIKTSPRKYNFAEPTQQNASAFTGTAKQIKHVVNPNKIAASNIFTGSMNVFGYLVSQSKPLQYQKDVGAVSFIARKNGTYTASSNSNSGTIVGLWSTNLGSTWNETCIWANGTNLARYPNGGIYNPLGNTNVNSAYFVGSGPIITTAWAGNWYASKQITTPGNTTPGPDQQSHMDASPTIKKHAMARYAFSTDGGIARSMATVVNDITGTTNVTYGIRGAAMVKGIFSAGAFIWSVDSFIPPVNTRPSDGSKIIYDVPLQAWDDAGINGYVVMLGSRAGTNAQMRGYQPIVYKTTTSGASWTLLPANDFADPNFFKMVYDRMYPINSNSTVICANFRGSEGFDIAVDVNGQLHLASMVYGHYSNDLDSLDYRYTFGTEQYSYGETGPFEYPVIYDFFTKTSGGWSYHMVDSMGTEGPSGTSGQPGYGSNVWSDGAGAKMDQDARIQMSRTSDGSKLFFSWSESDSGITGLKWNIYPDIKMKGIDLIVNNITPRFNITNGDVNLDQASYYQYMCNKAAGSSSTCVSIPFTMTKNATLNGSINVNTYIINGVSVCPTSYTAGDCYWKGNCGSVSEANNITFSEIQNFPNPTNNETTLIISLKKAVDFDIIVYNSVGQKIVAYKINGHEGSNEFNLDLSTYNSGLYLITVVTDSFTETKKIIKE